MFPSLYYSWVGGEVTTCSLLAILRLSVSLCRGCFDLQYGTRVTRGFGEAVAFWLAVT